jgi:hypothetical protein
VAFFDGPLTTDSLNRVQRDVKPAQPRQRLDPTTTERVQETAALTAHGFARARQDASSLGADPARKRHAAIAPTVWTVRVAITLLIHG